MKTLKTILTILLLSFIFSCSKDDPQPEIPKVTTVYVGGTEYETPSATNATATIWVNGLAQHLSTTLGLTSVVNSICVDGKDVYAVGYEGDFSDRRAVKWKNGVKTTLSTGNSDARGVFISNGKVYIVGQESNVATFWTPDNQAHHLTTSQSDANSVFANGDDIYIVGSGVPTSGGAIPFLWEVQINNTGIGWSQNPITTINGSALSVFINGNDVYTAGILNTQINTAKLWKSNTTTFSVATSQDYGDNTSMTSVFAQGIDVYAAGHTSFNGINKATIWKNNTPSYLSQNLSLALAVTATATDTYVAGGEVIGTSSSFNAVIWKNDVKQALSTNGGIAHAIFVTEK